jgi:DNA-binding NarL/FixJ family response regulator
MPRVAVVAASAARRDALRVRAAGSGIEIVRVAGTLDEAADADADVVVVSGRELLVDALDRAEDEDVAVVALVNDSAALADARRATAASSGSPDTVRGWALLPETASTQELRAAILAADAGLAAWPAHWAGDERSALADAGSRSAALDGEADEDVYGAESLTRREQEILELLSLGLSNRRIAERLGISGHTVKFHVAAIYGKLGVSGRTAAVNRALRRGILKI